MLIYARSNPQTMRLNGSIVPMVTPLDTRQRIDTVRVREFTNFLTASNLDGLFPCGSTGEFASLSSDERITVIEGVAAEAGETPVLAGCGSTSITETCDMIDRAYDVGADYAVVVTPYYHHIEQAGMARYFTRVADSASLPVMMYNIPGLTGVSLDVDTVVELSHNDNIVGIKDSSGNLRSLYAMITETPHDFPVFQGTTVQALTALEMGVDGLVAGEANAAPNLVGEIHHAFASGDRSLAGDIMRSVVYPINKLLLDVPTIPALKYLASKHGFEIGSARCPIGTLSHNEESRLDVFFEDYILEPRVS